MESRQDKIERLRAAFAQDDFEFKDEDVFEYPVSAGKAVIGIRAEHQTATNFETEKKKRAYYIEGNPYQLGWLMGMMAEPEIDDMVFDYLQKVVFDFFGFQIGDRAEEILGTLLYWLISAKLWRIMRDVPKVCVKEIKGLLAGCKTSNPKTRVTYQRLKAINFGVDVIQALIYDFGAWRLMLQIITVAAMIKDRLVKRTRSLTKRKLRPEVAAEKTVTQLAQYKIRGKNLKMPVLCNSLSAFGDAASGKGHFFGRDFMFSTAGVYHRTSGMIIYKPDEGNAFVAQSTPGFVGVAAAMSKVQGKQGGLGIGINLVAGYNTCRRRPGFNSLALARYCIQKASSLSEVIDIMASERRGVSYLYPVSDGVNDQAAVIEAGKTAPFRINRRKIDRELYPHLPKMKFFKSHATGIWQNGLMVRSNTYEYKNEYLEFTKKLFPFFKRTLVEGALDEIGYIDPTFEDKNCPDTCYFPPQRESRQDIVISSNGYIIPEMRMYSMGKWIAEVSSSQADKIQWRYDDLNKRILKHLDDAGPIDFEAAKELITYLRPFAMEKDQKKLGPNAGYYIEPEYDGELIIDGSVSVMDLKNLVIESHFGFYRDEWVRISLKNYV